MKLIAIYPENDIAAHIKSYESKSCNDRMTWVPDHQLRQPFAKYLKFEK